MNRLRLSLRSGLLLASLLLVPALATGLPDPAKPAATPTPKAAAAAPKAAVPAPPQTGAAPPAAQPTMVNAASSKPAVAGTIIPPAATSPKSVLPPSPPAAPPLPPPPVAAQPAQPAPQQSAPAIDPSRAPKSYILSRYTGELADDDLKPISGIFRVTFKLFPDMAAPKEIWAETLFVTIVEGRYDVALGRVTPIGANLDGRQLFLSATLEEEPGERIPFAVLAADTRDDSPSGPIFRGKSFADVADRALVATRAATADNCATLGGKTAEEIDQSKELNKRVSELREALRDKSSIKLGGQQQVLERVGGAGGNSYQRQCPPGFVVTGFRGGQGQFLDSIEIVCNAIE
jgi:hypothetical protein